MSSEIVCDASTRSGSVRVDPGFDVFFRSEYPALVAVATALVGSFEDSEDLVQDTMIKALVRWPRVSTLQRPGGWCHHVLVNACRSWLRRRRTRQIHLSRQRRVEPVAHGPSVEVIAFWDAVRELPLRPRSCVALRYAGERSVEEIADVLGVPEGTVRSDLSRARAFIMSQLAHE